MSSYTFTPNGYEKLKSEYYILTTQKRPSAMEALREAREMGSQEDNLQYDESKAALEIIDGRIAELERMLQQGQVVEDRKKNIVGIGSYVTIEAQGEREKYVIVNPYESNPVAGKISYESPVGKSLLNRKPGETVTITLPHATLEYAIISIE
ncbi:GreA/GreB family elongation factor [Patescibacteria group bacterium]|nr:GreA/GreB family elongation factor [Patescibacteria group bacterium]